MEEPKTAWWPDASDLRPRSSRRRRRRHHASDAHLHRHGQWAGTKSWPLPLTPRSGNSPLAPRPAETSPIPSIQGVALGMMDHKPIPGSDVSLAKVFDHKETSASSIDILIAATALMLTDCRTLVVLAQQYPEHACSLEAANLVRALTLICTLTQTRMALARDLPSLGQASHPHPPPACFRSSASSSSTLRSQWGC